MTYEDWRYEAAFAFIFNIDLQEEDRPIVRESVARADKTDVRELYNHLIRKRGKRKI